MLLNFVLVLSFSLCTWAIDNTLMPEKKGVDVVCEVINKIEKSLIFSDDEKMLRRIAYVESRFGEHRGTYRNNYHGGIWQIDKIEFDYAINTGSEFHPNIHRIWQKIEKLLSKQKKDIKWEDLRIPLFSGVFARIRLYLGNGNLPASNELEAQGSYWKENYKSEQGKGTVDDFVQRVNEMNKNFCTDCNMCKGRMNIAIVMDGSGSIGVENYRYAKQAAENLINTFSNELVDVGYVLFSSRVEVIFPLKSNLTRDQMKEKIDKSEYPSGSTRTDLGIYEGVTILGMADNSTGVPKVMVIFTDGIPDDVVLAILSAGQAKEFNITIFAIGIGDANDINVNNLKNMVSEESFVIPVASYQSLIQFIDKINSATCSVPQTPDIGKKVKNDRLDKNEKRYFKFKLPSKGVTIKINNGKGKTKGYYSYTIENPSSAINDGEFTNDVFLTPFKSDNVRVKRDVENEGSVHITIQGQEDTNVYDLDTIEGNHTSGGDQLKTNMLCIITSFILFINFFSL